jgi:hypothetical protein
VEYEVAISVTVMAEIENCHMGEIVTYYHDMNTKEVLNVHDYFYDILPFRYKDKNQLAICQIQQILFVSTNSYLFQIIM